MHLEREHPDVASTPSGRKTLTPRQREMLRLLAEGKTTGEIADALVLSRATVRNHIAHLLKGLGVHSRLQAVLKARELDLLDL